MTNAEEVELVTGATGRQGGAALTEFIASGISGPSARRFLKILSWQAQVEDCLGTYATVRNDLVK